MDTLVLAEYNVEAVVEIITETQRIGKTPFVVVPPASRFRFAADIVLAFPDMVYIDTFNALRQLNPNALGFIYHPVSVTQWNCGSSFGTFYRLLTSLSLEQLGATRGLLEIPDKPRILIDSFQPEKLLNDWRFAFADRLSAQEEDELRSVSGHAMDRIRTIFLENENGRISWFNNWINGAPAPV